MRTPRLARFVTTSVMLALASSLALAQQPAQTASQFYLKFRAIFEKAKTVDDILPYMAKENRAQIEKTPPADRAKMFELLKMMNQLTDVKILKEEKTAEGAQLTVDALDPDKKKTHGKVTIVKEAGDWKMSTENWSTPAS
jgi:hypothetical protein